MKILSVRYLLFVSIILITACSDSDTASKTILLSLQKVNDEYRVSDCRVLNRSYKSGASQQGRFRIHLLDKNQKVIQKIGFDKMNGTIASESDMELLVPFNKDLNGVVLFKLDGSSGHYRLNTSKPLMSWALPDSILKKRPNP